jgi:hypothetical protein
VQELEISLRFLIIKILSKIFENIFSRLQQDHAMMHVLGGSCQDLTQKEPASSGFKFLHKILHDFPRSYIRAY